MTSEATSERVQGEAIAGDGEQSTFVFDSLTMLSRRRKFIFWFTFGAAVLAAITAFLIPNEYTAATVILPPAQNSSSSSALLSQLAGTGALATVAGANLGIKNSGDMYVTLFRSRTVEDSVIRRFNLMQHYHKKFMSDARQRFEELSAVAFGIKDGLINVTVTDRDPNFAAEMANGYVDEFRKLSDNLAITEASQRRSFFQQQLLEANQNLAMAEEAMKHTEQSTGILQVDSQAKSLIESAADLRAQIGMKEVELQGIRTYAAQDNPQLIVGEQQLAALKNQLAALAGSSQAPGSDVAPSKENIPEAGMEYIRKLRDVKYYETINELIARQFEAAKLDEARQGAIVQVADVAIPPDKKSSPHRSLIVLLMTSIAAVVACLWVLVAERWRQALLDPAESKKLQALRGIFFESIDS